MLINSMLILGKYSVDHIIVHSLLISHQLGCFCTESLFQLFNHCSYPFFLYVIFPFKFLVYILFNLIKSFTSIVIIVYTTISFFFFFEVPMFFNSSFVIHSFSFIILAWSHKRCSVISVPYSSFQILCILLLYLLIGLT